MPRRAAFPPLVVAMVLLTSQVAAAHTVLRRGDIGPDVLLWQRMLNIDRTHPIAEDGIFGPDTARASRPFDVGKDGLIGARDRRNWIGAFLTCCGALKPTVSHGSYGTLVGHAQLELNKWLRKTGAELLTIDLVFGSATEAAARKYQQAHGLLVDGIVGRETWGEFFGWPKRS